MKDLISLIDAIHVPFSRPEYVPSEGKTFCNAYVSEVCELYGYKGFSGMLANDMIGHLEKSSDWSLVPMDKCQFLANQGTLILAGIKGDIHGHINVICPGKEKTSGRWGTVPACSNIGKENFIGRSISWAFSELPRFWAWRSTL